MGHKALDREMRPFPWYEFFQMPDGEVTITDEDRTTRIFKARDEVLHQKQRFAVGKSMSM